MSTFDLLGPIISENDPPFFAPWVTWPTNLEKKSDALILMFLLCTRSFTLFTIFLTKQIMGSVRYENKIGQYFVLVLNNL